MGKSRISDKFESLKRTGCKAFIPYIMAGDPDLETTAEKVLLLETCGADIIELGVPFSDPMADGPTIQRSAERALAGGTTLKKVLALVARLRTKTQIPLILMTYYNPVFKYGEERFARDAVKAGVDGVIIPDLPPDEAAGLIKTARIEGLDTIFLIAPTSNDERIKKVVSVCTGFVYYVSMTGITGAGLKLDSGFIKHIGKVRKTSNVPVCVGFGVSTDIEAEAIASVSDGVIVGSAIVKRLNGHRKDLKEYLLSLRRSIK